MHKLAATIVIVMTFKASLAPARFLLEPAWRITAPQKCPIFDDEPLHAIMDRVCEICHEMYSHQVPNMRADCRANCFRTKQFRSCLEHFRPGRPHNAHHGSPH
ncbi:unnamed protein product [Toxocara canis]|uniref:Crustacean hyperglycemic hormone n=1 Tax=Toxocara canis TaxID=6265 RepID=A0A183TWM5_TOXCA|nr:unnamed protein product [Toxocara canis]